MIMSVKDEIKDEAVKLQKNIDATYAAGKQAEYDRFWDDYQENGNRTSYLYAFAGRAWTNETFKPKHPIKVGNATCMFYFSSIPHIDCEIDFADPFLGLTNMFASAWVERISRFKSYVTLNYYSSTFTSCSRLTDISFVEGSVIGRSINFKSSPLTVESAKRVITILEDYSGTADEYTYSVTFSASTLELLEAEGATAPNGDTWMNYIQSKGWTT